jgi:alkylation response protein AidB-like acyl-CoA dehydrogenase
LTGVTVDFDLTADQRTIKQTARELLSARSSWERVREHADAGQDDAALWLEVCELGWPGIAIGEESGGSGLGVVELAVLCEELGFALPAIPLLGSVMAALILEAGGNELQNERWLGGLASGELRGAVGTRELLLDAGEADVAVVIEGRSAFVGLGATIEPLATIDPTRRYGRVVDISSFEELHGDVATGIAQATIALSSELVGVAQHAMEMTVEYVKERKQFGIPVGAFQAVAHKCAGMLLATEGARSATYYAAWAADAAPERLAEGASLAKAAASTAATQVTADAIQAHGGIGFTWEADLHWLFKRAQLSALQLGGGHAHRRELAALVATSLQLASQSS